MGSVDSFPIYLLVDRRSMDSTLLVDAIPVSGKSRGAWGLDSRDGIPFVGLTGEPVASSGGRGVNLPSLAALGFDSVCCW